MRLIIPVRNKTKQPLRVQLEPWLDILDLKPGDSAEIEGDFGTGFNALEIEANEGLVQVYCPAETELRTAHSESLK